MPVEEVLFPLVFALEEVLLPLVFAVEEVLLPPVFAVEEVLLPLVFTVVEVLPAVVFDAEEVVRPVVFGAASVFLVAISNTPFRFSYKNLKITISQRLPFYNRQVLSNAILRFRVIETLKRKQRDYGISDVRCGGVAANVRR